MSMWVWQIPGKPAIGIGVSPGATQCPWNETVGHSAGEA
jgi:hypothetical protein